MLDFSWAKLIREFFLRNIWAKLLPIYCFTGFVMTHIAQSVWMEEEVYRGTSGFAVTASVMPPLLLVVAYILQQYKNANLLVRMGRSAFTRKLITHVLGVAAVFAIYYMAGVYFISAVVFTEGDWKSGLRGFCFWLIGGLILMLFLCATALLFILLSLKLGQMAPGIIFMLIVSYVFWRTAEFSGIKLSALLFLAGGVIIVAKGLISFLEKSDCRDWR